jgi:hypothetical protein
MFSLAFFEKLYRFPPFLSPLLVIGVVVSFFLTGSLFWPVCFIGALAILHLLRRPPLWFLAQLPDPARITLCFIIILTITGLRSTGVL